MVVATMSATVAQARCPGISRTAHSAQPGRADALRRDELPQLDEDGAQLFQGLAQVDRAGLVVGAVMQHRLVEQLEPVPGEDREDVFGAAPTGGPR
jgi:hypothetical protein